jgi:hypothetical protein
VIDSTRPALESPLILGGGRCLRHGLIGCDQSEHQRPGCYAEIVAPGKYKLVIGDPARFWEPTSITGPPDDNKGAESIDVSEGEKVPRNVKRKAPEQLP